MLLFAISCFWSSQELLDISGGSSQGPGELRYDAVRKVGEVASSSLSVVAGCKRIVAESVVAAELADVVARSGCLRLFGGHRIGSNYFEFA